VALYARMSTDDKGRDPENQLAQLREWCSRSGHEIVAEYVEHESERKGPEKRKAFAAHGLRRWLPLLLRAPSGHGQRACPKYHPGDAIELGEGRGSEDQRADQGGAGRAVAKGKVLGRPKIRPEVEASL
jgi:Resolvase, N terminal domain